MQDTRRTAVTRSTQTRGPEACIHAGPLRQQRAKTADETLAETADEESDETGWLPSCEAGRLPAEVTAELRRYLTAAATLAQVQAAGY